VLRRACATAVILLVFGSPGGSFAKSILTSDVTEMERLDSQVVQPADKIAPLTHEYEEILQKLKGRPVVELDNEDVSDLFHASYLVAFYTFRASAAHEMRTALDELGRRHLASRKLRQQMLDVYVSSRLFNQARRFSAHKQNVDLRPPPTFEDRSSQTNRRRTLMRVSGDARTLTRFDFVEPSSPYVVVVSSPWCHFSQAAVAEISKDSKLLSVMSGYSTWILPQSIIPDFSGVSDWNAVHSHLLMHLVYAEDEWPEISTWATPGFYFYENGRIVDSVLGWPSAKQLDAVRAGLEKIGLLH
jgi:hypothetical protein